MSSIVIHLQHDMAVVATDTLMVDTQGRPRSFTTKAYALPHLKMIIAGTGIAGIATKWFAYVNNHMVVRDIDHLNFHAQQALQDFWVNEVTDDRLKEYSTTIYHIGISADNSIHGYSYSSEYGFASEQLPYKTHHEPKADEVSGPKILDNIIAIMDSQRSRQMQVPVEKRIYIGGEVQVILLSADGSITMNNIHRFADADANEAAIYENFGLPD